MMCLMSDETTLMSSKQLLAFSRDMSVAKYKDWHSLSLLANIPGNLIPYGPYWTLTQTSLHQFDKFATAIRSCKYKHHMCFHNSIKGLELPTAFNTAFAMAGFLLPV